jgi:stress response protein YsnF
VNAADRDADEVVEQQIVPLVEEELVVETRSHPTGSVRVETRTLAREVEVDEVLGHETLETRRVPIGRYVDTAAAIRVEGDTTIIPVHEEVLVIERRLLLKEEVHVTRHEEKRRDRRRVSIRHQVADVARHEPEEA